MPVTIEQLGQQCHDAFAADPGGGIEAIRALIETALVDDAFVATHLGADNAAERQIIYEDPEFGFCILAHVYQGASEAPPHDHGPTWAIYGQATGVTEMTEYRCVAKPAGGAPGRVEATKSYSLEPGMAVAYPVGALHAPEAGRRDAADPRRGC